MITDDNTRDEKLQYDTNREAAKLSVLSRGKIDKEKYLTAEDILTSNEIKIIEQGEFGYSPLRRGFEKTAEKQIGFLKFLDLSNKKDELKQIEGIFQKNLINDLIRAKLKEIVNFQDIIKKMI